MLHRIALIAALFLCGPGFAAQIEQITAVTWRESYAGFGTYSGLSVSADGSQFWTVGDKGTYAVGALHRSDGQLDDVSVIEHGPLLDTRGRPTRPRNSDAEGLTRLPDGSFRVSFEVNHRVAAYERLGGPATALPELPRKAFLQNNSSLEALAHLGRDQLWVMPERSGALDRPFPIYVFRDGTWGDGFSVPRREDFLVVGADVGPDGRLYILERHLATFGFQTRIRRFDLSEAGLSGEEILLTSHTAQFDNLEGISLWRDPEGRIRILCISDDNLNFLQRTQLVEFTLSE